MTAPHPVELTVNGRSYTGEVEPRQSLADFLRDDLGLTGTHLGCEHGICGACTVVLDGQPVRSCLVFAVQAHASDVVTVEGLQEDGALHPLQEAFRRNHALQCGFCTPGFLMTLLAYAEDRQGAGDAGEREIRETLAGNLCRCTGYEGIVNAAREYLRERHPTA